MIQHCPKCKRLVPDGHSCAKAETRWTWTPGQTVDQEPRWRAAIIATNAHCDQCAVGFHATVYNTVVPCKCALGAIFDALHADYEKSLVQGLRGGFTRNAEFAADVETVIKRVLFDLDKPLGIPYHHNIYRLNVKAGQPWAVVLKKCRMVINKDSRQDFARAVANIKHAVARQAVTLQPHNLFPVMGY